MTSLSLCQSQSNGYMLIDMLDVKLTVANIDERVGADRLSSMLVLSKPDTCW